LNTVPTQLENVAVNDVLPRKTAWCDVIANWKFLGPWDNSHLFLMVPFTFAMRRHLIPQAPYCEVEKGGFGPPIFRWRVYRRSQISIFKSHSVTSEHVAGLGRVLFG